MTELCLRHISDLSQRFCAGRKTAMDMEIIHILVRITGDGLVK
jgi:hypothetical protein